MPIDTALGDTTTTPLLTTSDRERAHRFITEVYIPHQLVTRDDDGHRLDFRLRHLSSDRLTVGHLRYGTDTELRVPPMDDCYHMNLNLSGRTMVSQRGVCASTGSGRAGVLFSPTDPFTSRWSHDAVQFAVKLPRRALEAQLAALIGQPVERPIEFALRFDLEAGLGQALLASVRFLRDELMRPGGIARAPLARRQLETAVLTQVLVAVPNSYTDRLLRPDRPCGSSQIGEAVALVQEDPAAAWDVGALASKVGVTARSLQRGFREEVGLAPMAYVRAVRLDRVRSDLLGDPGGPSVTDAALRWGFSHLGRFAQQYRDRFGELPSQTRALRATAELASEPVRVGAGRGRGQDRSW